MKGFLILGYNETAVNQISISNLEREINRKNIRFGKSVWKNKVFHNLFSYVFIKDPESSCEASMNLPIVVGGDLYGLLKTYNNKLLNHDEAIKLVQGSDFNDKYEAFEGNACIGSFTDKKLIFQNDLEGYRKLYYFRNENIFCISTYLPFILAVVQEHWVIRKNAVLSYICSRESKWPLTFIENIFVLPPLSRVELTNENLSISSKVFSDFYNLEKISEKEIQEQLYIEYESIIKRKKSENTAVTLSGGYDSNCLTKLFTNVYDKNFTAVSVGYVAKYEKGTNINDETVYAEKVADKLDIPFKRYLFNKNDFFNELYFFLDTIDQPGHDPSSNFIMNKYLKLDNYQLVINGMGGDANFSNKRNLIIGTKFFNLSRQIRLNPFSFFGKFITYRGPFCYYKPYPQFDEAKTFHDLFERSSLFNSPICKYINSNKQQEIDKERALRVDFFNNLYQNAKTKQEIFYSLALFSSPDENHALSMAERNNIEILMPFVNTKSVLSIINGSHFHKINNRDFEMKIFGGIDENLLAKSKSGFSIPYAEWIPSIANDVFEYYNELKYFSKDDFDILKFQNDFKMHESFAKSNSANIVIWKLFVVKGYIEKYNLNI